MKEWFFRLIAGPLGEVVKPILSGVIAAILATAYAAGWDFAYKYEWLRSFVELAISFMNPTFVKSMSPLAVGTASAIVIWGGFSAWVITRMKGGVRAMQQSINGANIPINVEVDGVAVRKGETVEAFKQIVKKAEYARETANPKG